MPYYGEIDSQKDRLFRIPEVKSAVEEYGHLTTIVGGAADRLTSKAASDDGQYFQTCGVNPLHKFNYRHAVWLTDQAENIPFPKTVYHVTGLPAAKAISDGKPLLPTADHSLSQITTHKGIALHLYPMFLQTLEIDTGQLEDFLFSGPQVDAEQLRHDIDLPYGNTAEYDKEVVALFLQKSQDGIGYRLSHRLEVAVRALQQGKKPIDDPDLKAQVDSWLVDLYRLTHMREGRLEMVRDSLYGARKVNDLQLKDAMVDLLSIAAYRLNGLQDEPAQTRPAVLEIDTGTLIRDLSPEGLYTVLIGGRPMQTIFPSLTVTPNSVQTIFVHDSNVGDVNNSDIQVKTFDDIPQAAWLGSVDWRNVRPDMWNPLCAIRYDTNSHPPFFWIDAARRGMIAPLHSIWQPAMGTPNGVLVSLFGEHRFKFTETDLYKQHPYWFLEAISMDYPFIEGVFNRIHPVRERTESR